MTVCIASCVNVRDFTDLSEKSISTHPLKYVKIKNLKFAYIEKGTGPLVLLLHGFPENASTFDAVIDELALAGYRAVAPFTRGYYPTDIPSNNDYCISTLAKDAIQLIEVFGEKEAVIIGHDWGGSAAYAAASIAPGTVRKIVTISNPHPIKVKNNIYKSIVRAKHILLFQFRGISEWIVRRNKFSYLDTLYDRWSPTWKIPKVQMDKYKASLAMDGRLEAALGYYRGLFGRKCDDGLSRNLVQKTQVPTQLFSGGADGALAHTLYDNLHDSFDGQFKHIYLEDSGHFIHNQNHEIFMRELLYFLDSKD